MTLPRWTVVAAAGVALALATAGTALDRTAFAGNVLSELLGAFVGVVVALTLIERLVRRTRQRRWEIVSGQTYATLQWVLVKASLRLYMVLPAPRPVDADPFSGREVGSLATSLAALARALANYAEDVYEDFDTRATVDAVEGDFEAVRQTLMPRLLALGDEPELIERLATLEQRVVTLDYDAWLDERFGVPSHLFVQDVSVCVDAMQAVAELLPPSAFPTGGGT